MKTRIGFQTLVRREVVRFFSVFSQTIFPPVVSSFLYIFIFGFSLGRRIEEINGVPYLMFLIPGLIMMYVIEGSYANASSSLFISRWANNIEELLVTPLSYFEMVLAIILGALVRSLVIATGVFLVSRLFAATPIAHPVVVLLFIVGVSLAFASLGMIVALIAEEFEHLSILTTFVITPLVFFGGVFHSMDMVPATLQSLTAFNPMFYMVNGMRFGMLGTADVPILQCVAVVGTLAVTLFSVTVYLFSIGYKLRK